MTDQESATHRQRHIEAWTAVDACVAASEQSEVELPRVVIDFCIALGRLAIDTPTLAAELELPGPRVYPMIRLFCAIANLYRMHSDPNRLVYVKDSREMVVCQDEIRLLSFTVLGFAHHSAEFDTLEAYKTPLTREIMEKTMSYATAVRDILMPETPVTEEVPKRQQLRLMTPSVSEPAPETAQIAAEMTMALWRSWGLDSQAVLGAVARAVEEALPVIEEDRVSARIARQRLIVERLNDYLDNEGQSKAIVKLPTAYADYLFTLAATYATFKDMGEDPILIFEELHGGFLEVLAKQGKAEGWQAYYNSASSTLKLTTLLYPYQSRAIEQHLAWADARNAFVSIEPLLEADVRDSRWPVRVTVNTPWDFEIERLILDRFERRYKEATTLDPISYQVLEALDPLVQAVFKQLKGGI